MTILEEAGNAVNGARQAAYGDAFDNWDRTAALMSPVVGRILTAEEAILLLIQVKVARLLQTPDHRDSIVDIAGYAAVYEKVVNERAYRFKGAAKK
jgi:hypothetical protein